MFLFYFIVGAAVACADAYNHTANNPNPNTGLLAMRVGVVCLTWPMFLIWQIGLYMQSKK